MLRRPAVLLLACLLTFAARAADITVSAAASLGDVLRALAPLFEAAEPGTRVRLNLGASGALLQQLANGAPADVLLTADTLTMDDAQARGLVRAAARRDVAGNALVLVVPAAARAPQALAELALPDVKRIAIGLPASVPAGRYAQQALQRAGLWSAIEPKLISTQNVRQALDYVARGEVDAGFVYATDAALLPGKVSVALVVPTTTPVVYPAAPATASAQPALAQRFVDFLVAPRAQTVFARHGFGKP